MEDLIPTDNNYPTLSEEKFCKVKIKTEPLESPSESDPNTSSTEAEYHASIFESLCKDEIKIEPTECWPDQTSLFESSNEYTNKIEHTSASARSTAAQTSNDVCGEQTVNSKTYVSEEEKSQILAYKKAGHNLRYIAKKIGRNLATVYKVFRIQRLHEAASLSKELTTQSVVPQTLIADNADQLQLGKKTKNPISEEEKALILKYKAAGNSNREIASPIGSAHQNISPPYNQLKGSAYNESEYKPTAKKRKEENGKVESKVKFFSEEEKAFILSSKANGVLTRDIANQLGRQVGSINQFLRRIKKEYVPPVILYKKLPQEMLKKKRLTDDEKAQIRAYKKDGLGHCEIGRRIGRPHPTVSKYVLTLDESAFNETLHSGKVEVSEVDAFCEDGFYVKASALPGSTNKKSNNAKTLNESNVGIRNDTQALEKLKWLQEYFMLKENVRAMGIIAQLEQVYKGDLES